MNESQKPPVPDNDVDKTQINDDEAYAAELLAEVDPVILDKKDRQRQEEVDRIKAKEARDKIHNLFQNKDTQQDLPLEE